MPQVGSNIFSFLHACPSTPQIIRRRSERRLGTSSAVEKDDIASLIFLGRPRARFAGDSMCSWEGVRPFVEGVTWADLSGCPRARLEEKPVAPGEGPCSAVSNVASTDFFGRPWLRLAEIAENELGLESEAPLWVRMLRATRWSTWWPSFTHAVCPSAAIVEIVGESVGVSEVGSDTEAEKEGVIEASSLPIVCPF